MLFAARAESEGIENPRAGLALHEAGHVVAMALIESDDSAEAVLLGNRGYAFSSQASCNAIGGQIMLAAGPMAAARLARGWKPPAITVTQSQQAKVAGGFNELVAKSGKTTEILGDLARVRHWSELHASEHRSADQLFDLVMTMASEFVEEYRQAIEEAAAVLYSSSKVRASELQCLGRADHANAV